MSGARLARRSGRCRRSPVGLRLGRGRARPPRPRASRSSSSRRRANGSFGRRRAESTSPRRTSAIVTCRKVDWRRCRRIASSPARSLSVQPRAASSNASCSARSCSTHLPELADRRGADRRPPARPASTGGTPGCAPRRRRRRVGDAADGGDLVGPGGEELRQRAQAGRHQLVDHQRLEAGHLLQQRAHDDRLAAIALALQRERARQAGRERRVRGQQRVARRAGHLRRAVPAPARSAARRTKPSTAATSAEWPTSDAIDRSDFSAGRPSSSQLACASPKRTSIIALRIGVTCADRQLLERLAQGGLVGGGRLACCAGRRAGYLRVTTDVLAPARARSRGPAIRPPAPSRRATGGAGAAGAGERAASGQGRARPSPRARRLTGGRDRAGGASGVGRDDRAGDRRLNVAARRRAGRARGARGSRAGAGRGLRRFGRFAGDFAGSGARAAGGAGDADEAFGAGALGGAFGGDSALPSSPRLRSREKMLMLPPDADLLHRPAAWKTFSDVRVSIRALRDGRRARRWGVVRFEKCPRLRVDGIALGGVVRRPPGEHDGAFGLAAALGDAGLTQEGLGDVDRAGRVVGDDQAERLQRDLVVAGFLGAVRDLGRELAVLLVGVQRVAERRELPGAVAGAAPRCERGARASWPAPVSPCPCGRPPGGESARPRPRARPRARRRPTATAPSPRRWGARPAPRSTPSRPATRPAPARRRRRRGGAAGNAAPRPEFCRLLQDQPASFASWPVCSYSGASRSMSAV